jgi:hypothetical protein
MSLQVGDERSGWDRPQHHLVSWCFLWIFLSLVACIRGVMRTFQCLDVFWHKLQDAVTMFGIQVSHDGCWQLLTVVHLRLTLANILIYT